MEIKPKFEVGEMAGLVAHKKDNMRLFITAVLTETCMGGTQVSYVGRVYGASSFTKAATFSEIELEKLNKINPNLGDKD